MTEAQSYVLSRAGMISLRNAGVIRESVMNGSLVARVKMGLSSATFVYKQEPSFYQPMPDDKRLRPPDVFRRRAVVRFCRGVRSTLLQPRLRRVYGDDFEPSIEIVGVDGFFLNDAVISQKWFHAS